MPKRLAHDESISRMPPEREMKRHRGEWVAIVDRKVVAAGKDLKRVLQAGRKASPRHEPFMFHVLEQDSLLL
ncbi:MAG: hypothetical protein KGJ23_12130 [Euryarchaeota archaeon]|nr:hypothetical protein [Euryarchaeota archaeon]MDE1837345.1 hypothetical protein [Euryarchaeota archaeon]MDE1880923.1 hypothetical protein [Euryarchaeota archaeon]MDE2045623.1 hypothetical protein [Thermoplasmata archaeon]